MLPIDYGEPTAHPRARRGRDGLGRRRQRLRRPGRGHRRQRPRACAPRRRRGGDAGRSRRSATPRTWSPTSRRCASPSGCCALTGRDGRVFFANRGAEANEAAFKMARRTGRPHGRGRRGRASTAAPWVRSPSPGSRPSARRSSRCPAASPSCRTATPPRSRPRSTAARPPSSSSRCSARAASSPAPAGYLEAAREVTRRHGALLVLDEVQTGIGRTGAWFAHQRDGRRARRPHPGQGARRRAAGQRLPRLRRRGRAAAAGPARHDLRRQPGVLRGGARGARHHRGRRAAGAGRVAREGARRRASPAWATRWSRPCAAPA